MSVVHNLTGYDRDTDKLELTFELPSDHLEEISKIVGLPQQYNECFGSFPLEPGAAWKLSQILKIRINIDHYDWFIEPFASDPGLAG